MVANKARTTVASTDWLADVGHLAPWQVADANAAVRDLDRPDQFLIMKSLAEQVGKVLREPLFASDVDIVLRTASNVRGIFDGVHEAPVMARSISGASRAWDLVLKALDGLSYDALVDVIEVKPATAREQKPSKTRKTGGLAALKKRVVRVGAKAKKRVLDKDGERPKDGDRLKEKRRLNRIKARQAEGALTPRRRSRA